MVTRVTGTTKMTSLSPNHPCSWRYMSLLTDHLRRKLEEIRVSKKRQECTGKIGCCTTGRLLLWGRRHPELMLRHLLQKGKKSDPEIFLTLYPKFLLHESSMFEQDGFPSSNDDWHDLSVALEFPPHPTLACVFRIIKWLYITITSVRILKKIIKSYKQRAANGKAIQRMNWIICKIPSRSQEQRRWIWLTIPAFFNR